ncbi:MAG: hypothetical protein JWM80_6534 [Cyanobacteria bacterium RYN_339]|nr:hypothetical protein [Cyanobacteria bacterium RYN_339]
MTAQVDVHHAQRVLLFARELATATRRERLLAARTAQATRGTSGLSLGADPLVTAADALLAKVAEGEALLKGLQGEALARALAGFDIGLVAAAAKQLEARVAARRQGTQPLGGAPRTGVLPGVIPLRPTGYLPREGGGVPVAALPQVPSPPAAEPGGSPAPKGLFDRLKAWADPVTAPTATPPPAPDPARQAFDAATTFVKEVLAYVSPRLFLVKTAYGTTGLPARPKPWAVVGRAVPPAIQAAGIGQAEAPWVGHLAKAFLDDQRASREAQIALVRWENARAVDDRAGKVGEALAQSPPDRVKPLLAAFDLAAYRAAIFPLSHLHVTFQGIPRLHELFPKPPDAGVTTGGRAGI